MPIRRTKIDPAFEVFNSKHYVYFGMPYMSKKADFVMLAKLRKFLKVKAKEVPPDWQAAVVNYYVSHLSSYSLADLCSRYAIFRLYRVDRFSRPILPLL